MHVLVYTWYAPQANLQLGGTQQVVRDLLLGLSAAGVRLTVLCPRVDRGGLLPEAHNLRILPSLNQT